MFDFNLKCNHIFAWNHEKTELFIFFWKCSVLLNKKFIFTLFLLFEKFYSWTNLIWIFSTYKTRSSWRIEITYFCGKIRFQKKMTTEWIWINYFFQKNWPKKTARNDQLHWHKRCKRKPVASKWKMVFIQYINCVCASASEQWNGNCSEQITGSTRKNKSAEKMLNFRYRPNI